jgi:dTDP-glucose 4,6-dehydratase
MRTVAQDLSLEGLAAAFEDRTVFVTGADGFLGSHLTEALVGARARVHAFVRATSSGGLSNVAHLRDRMTVHFGDLRDRHSVMSALSILRDATDRPYVFHLGAQAHVGESWQRPYETFEANTLGTLNLLQSVVDLELELEKFDTAGTSEEYGNLRESFEYDFDDDGHVVLRERSPLNPTSIYATSKVAADFLTMNYHDAYGVPGVVTRMFNNYGPRQNPRYLTGTVITQALTRPQVELGNLNPMRDFCFVLDGVRGHLTVARNGRAGDTYCYGQGQNISVIDWAGRILSVGERMGVWSGRRVESVDDRFRPGTSDVMALKVGFEKLHLETGWAPTYTWEEGIERTIRWYSENPARWKGQVDWHLYPRVMERT